MAAHARVAAASVKPSAATRRVQRACAACGMHGQGECESCKKKKVQRRAGSPRDRAAHVDGASFERGGQPLDAQWRRQLEPFYGADFADVRIHDDAASHAAARRLSAHAFTVGQHIHFARDRFRPEGRAGLHLLAHELTHTVQQRDTTGGASLTDGIEIDPVDSPFERAADRVADAVTQASTPGAAPSSATMTTGGVLAAPTVQRVGFFETLSRLFGEGTFSESELLQYLKFLDDHAAIEGDYDSDNKAREIIRRWRNGDPKFQPTIQQKQLMLLEMIDGPTLDADEHAILELLRGSADAEVRRLLATAGGESDLKDEFHGSESDELDAFLEQWHRKPGNAPEPPSGRRGHITEITVDQNTPQTVTVRYVDGRIISDQCSSGKGTCCVEPGSNTGPTDAQTQENDSNWTPVGNHTVLPRRTGPHGIKYWTQFHWRAVALHDYSPVDGTPLSHGCVRLHEPFAQRIREGAVTGVTRVHVTPAARPRCDHPALVAEWNNDFNGGAAADGDRELRKHLEVAFRSTGAALDETISQRVIPRCGAGTRPAPAGGRRRP
jgi:hypothetical protein